MSFDVRYITTGTRTGFYVRNSGVTPTTVTIYDKKEDVPESIRHYCHDEKEPQLVGPDFARILGCQNILYPGFPECGDPKYSVCVAESCKFGADGDWTKCPYFPGYEKGE